MVDEGKRYLGEEHDDKIETVTEKLRGWKDKTAAVCLVENEKEGNYLSGKILLE